MTVPPPGAGIEELRAALAAGHTTPAALVESAYERLSALDDATIVSFVPADTAIIRARRLGSENPAQFALWGLPFVVKDNIDVAGVPTTAGCPAFATTPAESATVVRRLEAAGAVVIAKSNLDQFATGLVGTRSPYGTPRNPFDAGRVPGGSSSGSAVAVASGVVPFALGTDTAGSGRVPAAFNGIVGAKPTRGWLSTTGVVPAVRTIDCVSVFALSVPDAWSVLEAAGAFDPTDPFSRRSVPAIPPATLRIGVSADTPASVAALFGDVHEVDLAPFLAAGDLLYNGPWIAERVAAVGDFLSTHPDDFEPTVRSIIDNARRWTAAEAAAATYRLAALRRRVDEVWTGIDALVLPTVPSHPTLAEVAIDPIGVNAALGRYTTFANMLDLCAVTVPVGIVDGLPVSVSVLTPAWADGSASAVAHRIHTATGGLRGVTGWWAGPPWEPPAPTPMVELAVAGAHLRGEPLHGELEDLGASFVTATVTAPCYRLYALAGTTPAKPGLVRVGNGDGAEIEVEVYRLTHEAFGELVASVPTPLSIGKVLLANGPMAGFLCEPFGLDGAIDITQYGGWRAYRSQAQTR